jgi:hypothetical protein
MGIHRLQRRIYPEGVIHTSPGHRPGFCGITNNSSPARAIHGPPLLGLDVIFLDITQRVALGSYGFAFQAKGKPLRPNDKAWSGLDVGLCFHGCLFPFFLDVFHLMANSTFRRTDVD